MTALMPELPVVAYGYENTRITGEKNALMMVKLDNSGDQYPELAVPLVRLSDAVAVIEARQLPSGLIDYLRSRAAAGERGYTTLGEWVDQLAAIEAKLELYAKDAERPLLQEIELERQRQDGKWGGAAHDDSHDTSEFVQIINDYAGWARQMACMGSYDKARRRLVQVAALAVAACESIDRAAIEASQVQPATPQGNPS